MEPGVRRAKAIAAILLTAILLSVAAFGAYLYLRGGTPGPSRDTTPPSRVTGLTVTDAHDGHLNLAWNPAADNVGVVAYGISRNGTRWAESGNTSFMDAGLQNMVAYTYAVAATDAAGNEGARSDPASGTPTSSTLAPDFTVTDTEGSVVHLRDLMGQIVYLDFMFTQCIHCQRAMEEYLVPLQANYSGEVVMLSISVSWRNETLQDLIAFKSTYGASWPFALDTDNV